MKEVVEEACIEAKEKYKTDIYAVVSDNVSTMICMGKKIDQWHVTCNSHSGNLLARSMVESSFTAKVVLVLKEFKSASLERKLVNQGGKRISLPGETRWCSYRDSYRCFLANLTPMRLIAAVQEKKVKREVVELIQDEKFVQETLEFIIIFDGVCELVNKCQKSDTTIADALQEWLKLEFPIDNDLYESLLRDRLKKVVNPIMLAANILHPVYKGNIPK